MKYPDEYRDQILQKLLRAGGPSVMAVSRETGIHHATLYNWVREKKNGRMNGSTNPRKWSLRQKQAALLESRSKSEEELGRWLREQGLRSEHLELFEKEILSALAGADKPDRSAELEIRELRKDLDRKDKTIAEMSALLVLKKKLQTVLSD